MIDDPDLGSENLPAAHAGINRTHGVGVSERLAVRSSTTMKWTSTA